MTMIRLKFNHACFDFALNENQTFSSHPPPIRTRISYHVTMLEIRFLERSRVMTFFKKIIFYTIRKFIAITTFKSYDQNFVIDGQFFQASINIF